MATRVFGLGFRHICVQTCNFARGFRASIDGAAKIRTVRIFAKNEKKGPSAFSQGKVAAQIFRGRIPSPVQRAQGILRPRTSLLGELWCRQLAQREALRWAGAGAAEGLRKFQEGHAERAMLRRA